MTLSSNITRPATPPATTDSPAGAGDRLTKDQIVGELIAFAVTEYDTAREGSFGASPFAVVDLLVVTGAHAGTRDTEWWARGNLARQLAEAAPGGATTIGRVVTGPGRQPGTSWYGVDTSRLTGDDVAAARSAVEAATGSPAAPPARPAPDDRVPF